MTKRYLRGSYESTPSYTGQGTQIFCTEDGAGKTKKCTLFVVEALAPNPSESDRMMLRISFSSTRQT